MAICLALVFLLAPIAAVLAKGVPGITAMPDAVWVSALRSLGVAAMSTGLVCFACLMMALAADRLGPRGWLVESAGLMAIAASPLVLGTGLFILVFPWVDPGRLALPVTALVNAIVTLPFALRGVIPALQSAEAGYGRLADNLGLAGWSRMRLVILPRLRRPLGFSAGIAAALSMGDLGVIALFADPEAATLPLQVYRLMGAYRMHEAAGASVLLVCLSFGLFWLFDTWGRGRADT
jgi:thiamine transport system permease protein